MFPPTGMPPSCPAPVTDGVTDAENCRRWIEQVWADAAVASAIELAAPSLAAAVCKIIDGKARRSRIRRTAHSVTRYLLRMQFRATPFGLFAGPAPARLGMRTGVRLGTQHTAFARADAIWLHHVVIALERNPEVLRHLHVVADPTITVRGTQIAVPCQPGLEGPTETTLRRTGAAELVVSVAGAPTLVKDLVAKVEADYPGTAAAVIEEMVRGLVAHRVLLTDLHAPMTRDDALGHLVDQLDRASRAGAPDTAVRAQTEELRNVHRLLHQHDRAHPDEQRTLRAQAATAMNRLAEISVRSLAVHLRPDCDIVLPRHVATEASRALDVIGRISPYPNGSPAWRDYRTRFLERYSTGTVVPVRELTDPDTGLGFPVGYRNTVLPRPVLATTPRDEHLLALAQEAALTDQREIVLTEDDIKALSTSAPAQVPAHIEFTFAVLARSQRALDEGRFTLSTVGLSLAAGITTGRFLPFLEPSDLNRVKAVHAALPTLTEGALRGQVSGPPLKVPINNVSRSPLVAPELLSIGEHNSDATLGLDDLGVVADASRFHLVSLSTGQGIEPTVMNAVELSSSTHPLIRFVCELPRSHTAVLMPFFWGAASRLPFLPEVRVGRTVLSAALWRLRHRDLGDGDDWNEQFTNWRCAYGLPRTVYLGASDQRLRLDLDIPVHRELLRAELKRHGKAVLHEAPEEGAYGWLDRAHEVAMTFASEQKRGPAPTIRATATRDAGRMPGSSHRVYVKLYGSTARVSDVLTQHMPRLLREWGSPPSAWFIRYADPDPHIRLRLRLSGPDAFGSTADVVARWADELRREGLLHRVQWDTDHPETGRYGTGRALEAAENYFVTDSTAAVAQLALGVPAELRPAVTAASFVNITSGFLGSRKTAFTWLTRHLLRSDGGLVPRNVQAFALRLAETDARTILADFTGGDAVADAWEVRRHALIRYRQTLAEDVPDAVLPSLLHMHHNRAAGIDPTAEAFCRRIARATAHSRTFIPEGDEA
ncbi:lantibiotic dehydratase [Streptomyces californicus]|uniref:lantibiotic dehydratase n=1 Tax=Streptomyces californicus TaxID=67351 RepID=UPI0037B98B91